MERIDPKKARAVWQRVMAAKHGRPPMQEQPPITDSPQMQEQPPQREQPSEAELQDWLADSMALVRGYRSMNAGRYTPLLRRMAGEELAQHRRLAALYFRLYGRRPEVLSGAAPGRRSLAAGLRDAYGAEQNAVRQWREAATRYPANGALFEWLARNDRRHAEQLRRMMPAGL